MASQSVSSDCHVGSFLPGPPFRCNGMPGGAGLRLVLVVVFQGCLECPAQEWHCSGVNASELSFPP
eukprot:3484797-Amphidinium_carterae.2